MSIQTYSCELGWFLHIWRVKLKKLSNQPIHTFKYLMRPTFHKS